MKFLLTRVVLPGLITAVGLVFAVLLFVLAPEAERLPPEPVVALVEVVEATPLQQAAHVSATGSVIPARRVTVVPEVSGKIVFQSDELVPGGRVTRGQVLARVDTRDYQLTIEQEQARVRQAELELELERSRGEIAKREWELLGDGRPADQAPLALRTPQLATAERSLSAARSGLERARLSLERTALRAPFDAIVVEEGIDLGQVVGPTTAVATLVGTEQLWVQVSVPVERLALLEIPGVNSTQGSPARVAQPLGDGGEIVRLGQVLRLQGELDPQTRTATLLVGIDDPLDDPEGGLPLLPGAYVDVDIVGRSVAEVVALPRAALVDGGSVWLADAEDQLARRDVEIGWSTGDRVMVTRGLAHGERVVVSPLSLPVEGMPVRIEGAEVAAATANTPATL